METTAACQGQTKAETTNSPYTTGQKRKLRGGKVDRVLPTKVRVYSYKPRKAQGAQPALPVGHQRPAAGSAGPTPGPSSPGDPRPAPCPQQHVVPGKGWHLTKVEAQVRLSGQVNHPLGRLWAAGRGLRPHDRLGSRGDTCTVTSVHLR